ncbi:hypothetical protein FRB90_002427 [Tulasnella sp. 427]|nr:hypothetical protein FRB90_002427 [Tulasnella sp. 427]
MSPLSPSLALYVHLAPSLGLFRGGTYDPKTETPNLNGKVAIVTGGNGGVGRESTRHLVTYGAKVYIAARSKSRIQEAIDDLRQSGAFKNGGSAHPLLVDFSLLKDVKRAAEEFLNKEKRLDILYYTSEGLQATFAVNAFAPWLFINTLLPLLKKTAEEPGSDVRIVAVGSGTISMPPPITKLSTIEDLYLTEGSGPIAATSRYGTSKLCHVLLIKELQSRLDSTSTRITCLNADPAVVATAGAAESIAWVPTSPLRGIAWRILKSFLYSPDDGAASSKFATSSKRVSEDREMWKGAYVLSPVEVIQLEGQMNDSELAGKFWRLAERVCEEVLRDGQLAGQPVSKTVHVMLGFSSSNPYDPKTDTPNLSGKVAIVTGGNAGVGRESARHLVRYGAKVYIAARNEGRIAEAIDDFRESGAFANGGSAHMLLVDFSSLRDVKQAAEEFSSNEERLDILRKSAIHAANILVSLKRYWISFAALVDDVGMLPHRTMDYTDEGLQTIFAVNAFGTFLFIKILLQLLKKTAEKPNSDVGSGSIDLPPKIAKLEAIDDLYLTQGNSPVAAMKRYGMSKLCHLFIVHELQSRLDETSTPIMCLSADPGVVRTPGVLSNLPGIPAPFRQILTLFVKLTFQTPDQGATSSKFTTTAEQVTEEREKWKRAYVVPPATVRKLKGQPTDAEMARKFWALAERVCEEVLTEGKLEGQPVGVTL